MTGLTLVTWNVNGLRARIAQVLKLLERWQPDVLCLQETRLPEPKLPLLELRALGYQCFAESHGGRAGVATVCRLSRASELESRARTSLEAGRRLRVSCDGVSIDNVYVPTRKAIGKLEFLDQLREDYTLAPPARSVLCGDFNLCSDERDYASSSLISEAELFPNRVEDHAYRALRATGLYDCFRRHYQESGHYTWFDYRPWTLAKNYGLRLDYVLATESVTCSRAELLGEVRRWPKPSDHVPLWVELEA
ncbi:MAG TPA: exodeoxyribonuclease III [Polyangiaceae bacterium]|nr:exodeoxyribonuclease III [Polyangiaceae bacterium]